MDAQAARRLALALTLVASGAGSSAAPSSIDLSTGQPGWFVSYRDRNGHEEFGEGLTYACLGGAPQPDCLSPSSNGFAGGTWLNGADPSLFTGAWTAMIGFSLPDQATNVRLVYQFLGVDDRADLLFDIDLIDTAIIFGALPHGDVPLPVALTGASGSYVINLNVINNGADPFGPPQPLGPGDGTAVALRASVVFNLPDGQVPEPAGLPLLGMALAAAWTAGQRRQVRCGPPAADGG